MSGDANMRRWKLTKSFTEQLIASAPPSIQISIVVFNTQIIRRVAFGHSRNELLAAIDQSPNANGGTSLWNSLLEASDMFSKPVPGDTMLVISDFGDNAKKSNAAEVQRALLARGVRMFGVGILGHYFASEEERESTADLFALVKETGGDAIEDVVGYRGDLPGLLTQLFDKMGRFYVLSVTPSSPLLKRERLNLSLIASNGKKNKGVVLYYPQHLNPCIQ